MRILVKLPTSKKSRNIDTFLPLILNECCVPCFTSLVDFFLFYVIFEFVLTDSELAEK